MTDYLAIIGDADFEFTREDDGLVWAHITAGYGIVLGVRSDEPSGCREWVLDEVEVHTDKTHECLYPRRPAAIPYESDLGRALTAAFDRWVAYESTKARYWRGTP